MNINNGEFITNFGSILFDIKITQESDWSQDGGHSFENVTNTFQVGKDVAAQLVEELTNFINDK